MQDTIYDTIIIGAGAAGLTAAIYSARRNLKTLVLSKDIGGQTNLANEIENYPGIINQPSGFELMQTFRQQAESFGAVIKLESVLGIKPETDFFKVKTGQNEYQTKTIILAFGLDHKKLGASGEDKFVGRGVAYCAICDGPLFRNKIVAVVGGGNSSLDAAIFLSGIAKMVYLIHRRDSFKAEALLEKKVREAKNIEIIFDSEVKEIKGDEIARSIMVKDKEGTEKEIEVDGVFVEIGYEATTDWLADLIKLNNKKEIIIDGSAKTSLDGIFAAGDVTNAPHKQIVISAGEGARAALEVYEYLKQKEGLAEAPDWGRRGLKSRV